MSWTNYPCIPKWTFTDNEATDFDEKLLPGGEITLSIDTFSVLYASVIEALSATTVTLRLYSDEDRTNEVIVGDYTGQPYTLAYYNGWTWKPTLYNGKLDPEGRGTYVSRQVELYISGGKLVGEYVAEILPNDEFVTRFRGTFTPFPLAIIGLEATVDTGSGSLPAATYNFFVTAVDSSAREGGASWIEVVVPSTGHVDLTWYPVEDAVSYNIYRDCELLESGILVETYEDAGQTVEDANTPPPRDPEPTIPDPVTPIIDVTIDPETGAIKFDVTLEENDIVQTVHPNVILEDDGSGDTSNIYTDLDGNTVITKSNGDTCVSYHRIGNGRICEGSTLLSGLVPLDQIFDIAAEVAFVDPEVDIGPAITWNQFYDSDFHVAGVQRYYRVELKEEYGITYPASIITGEITFLNGFLGVSNSDSVVVNYYASPSLVFAVQLKLGDNEGNTIRESISTAIHNNGIRLIQYSKPIADTSAQAIYRYYIEGCVFELECRDADPGEKLRVSSSNINYSDTYSVGGNTYGTRVATRISGDLSNDVQPILNTLDALYRVFADPFAGGYMNILGARSVSSSRKSSDTTIPQLTFPFNFPPEIVVDLQEERENTIRSPETQRQYFPGFE